MHYLLPSKKMFPAPDIAHARLAWDMAKDSLDHGDITESEFKLVRARAKARLKTLGYKMAVKKSLGSMSYSDLRDALQAWCQSAYGKRAKEGYWQDYPYVVDIYESEFVVEKDGKFYIADYSVGPDQKITVGDFYAAVKTYDRKGEPVKNMKPGASSSQMKVARA